MQDSENAQQIRIVSAENADFMLECTKGDTDYKPMEHLYQEMKC